MRICRKCAKQVDDDSKICRDCGAILEETQEARDDPVPGATFQPYASVESGELDPVPEDPTEWIDESLPGDIHIGPLVIKQKETARPEPVCPRCESSEIMHGVTVFDQGQGSNGKLQVVISGNPSALVFKDRLFGELQAEVCANCGHVELRVTNPRELHRQYRKSLG